MILKPLLLITNIAEIKIINSYAQFILMIVAILLFYQKLGILYAGAFTFNLMALNPISLAMTFQYSIIFYIMILSVIIILWKNQFLLENNLYSYFFLCIGIATAFFDFLTYPIVGIGIPLLTYFILNKNNTPPLSPVKILIYYVLCWLIGYAGMWFGKWIIAWGLTGYNVLGDALTEAQLRISSTMGDSGEVVNPLWAISLNFMFFSKDISGYIAVIILTYGLLKNKKSIFKMKNLPFIIVAILPLIWYIILCNHSIASLPIAYRSLVVTEFAIFCLLIENIKLKSE